MDVQLRELAARQDDLVASWQLLAAGWTRKGIKHAAKKGNWRRIHRGVYALTQGTFTLRQRWLAATLTAPATYLSHASAGACHGFYKPRGNFEIVTRSGSGGPRTLEGLLICRSSALDGNTTVKDGIPITTAERTLIDLAPHLNEEALRRAFRESIRLRTTTPDRIRAAVASCGKRRNTALLAHLATHYRHVPYQRTRSDAEGLALERLQDSGAGSRRVNVKIAGKEADLVDPERKEILEIDGPQYHQFPDEDALKEAAWREAGYTVRRVSSDDVYGDCPRAHG